MLEIVLGADSQSSPFVAGKTIPVALCESKMLNHHNLLIQWRTELNLCSLYLP